MLGCLPFLITSCDEGETFEQRIDLEIEIETEIEIIKDKTEYKMEMQAGTTVPIKVSTGKTYNWVSSDNNIAYIVDNTITAVKVGKVDIIDSKGSNTVIHVSVIEQQ